MKTRDVIKHHWRVLLILFFVIVNLFIWHSVKNELPSKYLKVAFLNVGQGDAIYIESPWHNKIMIDGGPQRAVLSELGKVMPFYTRTIDTLVVTNPDADHYSGFIDMLGIYKINRVIEPGTKSDTARYAEFEKRISEKKIQKLIAIRGMVVHLGGGADLTILFPDKDVSDFSTNDGSIVARLAYGSTSVMFTGDAPNKTEEYTASLSGVKSTILKVGHHGSRTSASESFVSKVDPDYAIISAGFENRYGHPHKETTDLFKKLNIPYFITYERGTVIATSDGLNFQIKTHNKTDPD